MKPLREITPEVLRGIKYLFTDIDDTLTTDGRMLPPAFEALARLRESGVKVIPVTGGHAGGCEHIARMWPVDAAVAENGAVYFYFNETEKRMYVKYWKSEEDRRRDRARLDVLRDEILAAVPRAVVAVDQCFRVEDLAIDYACDTRPPLDTESVELIKSMAAAAGANATASSIHVNIWFGDFNKPAAAAWVARDLFGEDLDAIMAEAAYVGDSTNDVAMFAKFPLSFGVANIRRFEGLLSHEPQWVTEAPGSLGFAELAATIVASRSNLDLF